MSHPNPIVQAALRNGTRRAVDVSAHWDGERGRLWINPDFIALSAGKNGVAGRVTQLDALLDFIADLNAVYHALINDHPEWHAQRFDSSSGEERE